MAHFREVNVNDFTGHRYRHVRSENLDEFIHYMNYFWFKSSRLQRSPTIVLLKRFNCFFNEYEYIEMGIQKKVFYEGYEPCFPEYTFSNGWQRKKWHFEGNKMIKTEDGNKRVVTVWEFYENQVVQSFYVDHIVARKFFERTHSSASAAYSFCEQWCVD